MPPPNMIEAEARQMLRDCGGFGGLEAWIAGRRWKTAPGAPPKKKGRPRQAARV
jgi:hypothetical protein